MAAGKTEKRWRVVIANAWGGNRGDEAMINTLGRILMSISPGMNIDVLPYRNEDLDIDKSLNVRRNCVGEYWYANVPDFLLERDGTKVVRKFLRLSTTVLHKLGVLAPRSIVDGCDLMISAPQGPTLGDMYNAKERIVDPLRAARDANVPYMILAVSAGPFYDDAPAQEIVGSVLSSAKAVVVREALSLSNVLAKYPSLRNVDSAIDIVYARKWTLDDKDPSHVVLYDDFMSRIRSNAVGGCISLTPARDPTNKFDEAEYIEKYVALVDHVIARSEGQFLLFPHLVFDMPALEKIRSRVKYPEKVFVLPPVLDSDFQRDAISRMSFFVSSRYHPTIFSVQAGVPFLCIKNQFKVEGMLQRIGLGDVPTCWQDESISTFLSTFDACWNLRAELKEQVDGAAFRAQLIARKYEGVLRDEFVEFSKR